MLVIHQNNAFPMRKLRTSLRPKLKISVPQSWCSPWRGSEVLVEIRPVKFREPMRVLWEMGRDPIHDDADAGLVKLIDEMPELVGRSEPARRRVIIRDLISPRTFKGMLGDRHELDVRVAHFNNVGQERFRELEVTQGTIAFLILSPPGAEMNFVNAERTGVPPPAIRFSHPALSFH